METQNQSAKEIILTSKTKSKNYYILFPDDFKIFITYKQYQVIAKILNRGQNNVIRINKEEGLVTKDFIKGIMAAVQ